MNAVELCSLGRVERCRESCCQEVIGERRAAGGAYRQMEGSMERDAKDHAGLHDSYRCRTQPFSKMGILTYLLLRLRSRDQGCYSCSSEACQDHQKLDSFTPFLNFTAYFTNSFQQINIHPKNMQSMERLALILLSCILQPTIFQI